MPIANQAPNFADLAPKWRYRAAGWSGSMRGREDPLRGRAKLVASIVAAALLSSGGLTFASSTSAAAPHPATPPGAFAAWSNGVVNLTFPADVPRFSLASAANGSVLSDQTLSGLAEISASGAIVAFASFLRNSTHWGFTARSDASGVVIFASSVVRPFASGGEWESNGSAGVGDEAAGVALVNLTFYLNDTLNSSSVSYDLAVSGWPWFQGNDTLGLEVRSNASATGGSWSANGSNSIDAFRPGAMSPYARFSWASTATALYTGGGEADSSVGSYRNLTATHGFLVRLQFSAVTGGYSTLNYDPMLTLLWVPHAGLPGTPPLPAWAFTPVSLVVLAAAGGGSLALAILGARRRRPPDHGL